MPTQPRGRIVGVAPCPYCGHVSEVRQSEKNGFLYQVCPPEADGGCKTQFFPRSKTASEKLAARITKWKSAADKKKWLGDAPAKKETKAEPAPADDGHGVPANPSKPWWDKEL